MPERFRGGYAFGGALNKQRALLLGHKWQSANYTLVTAVYTRYSAKFSGWLWVILMLF